MRVANSLLDLIGETLSCDSIGWKRLTVFRYS